MMFPTGSKFFFEGQSPSKAFMLTRGRARLFLVSKRGERILLRTVRPGSLLGLSAIMTGVPYEAMVETLSPADGFFIDRLRFMRFLHSHPEKAFQAVEVLSDDLTETVECFRCLC